MTLSKFTLLSSIVKKLLNANDKNEVMNCQGDVIDNNLYREISIQSSNVRTRQGWQDQVQDQVQVQPGRAAVSGWKDPQVCCKSSSLCTDPGGAGS